MDPGRQRLQQLHQGHGPVRAQCGGDGHAVAFEQAVGRHLAVDLPDGWGRHAAPGHEGHHQRDRDDDEVGTSGDDAEEERPADEGQEGDVQDGRTPAHTDSAAGAGTWWSKVSTTWTGVVLETHNSGRRTSRWARAATATAFTSSGRTKSRPRMAAWARASFNTARLPRGEAPSPMR